MALTTEQQATLKAYITAEADLNALPNTPDGAYAIADLLNLEADPAFVIWRSDVSTADCKAVMDWTEFVDLGAGEREGFLFMISNHVLDFTALNVQSGILDIFSGPTQANTRNALTALGKRNALRVEKVFSTGTGTDESPATADRTGTIGYQDVYAARNS